MEKSSTSGYAEHRDWDADLRRWRRRSAHPYLTVAGAPFQRDPYERFRISRPPLPACSTAERHLPTNR